MQQYVKNWIVQILFYLNGGRNLLLNYRSSKNDTVCNYDIFASQRTLYVFCFPLSTGLLPELKRVT